MSPTTPSNTGSLKIGRPRSRSKSPFRSFRWKRGSSSRAADSDDEAGKIKLIYLFKSIINKFRQPISTKLFLFICCFFFLKLYFNLDILSLLIWNYIFMLFLIA